MPDTTFYSLILRQRNKAGFYPKKPLMEAIRMKKVNKCYAVHCMEELSLYSVNKNKMLIISIISIFKIIIFLHYLHILSMILLCFVHGIFFHISLVQ